MGKKRKQKPVPAKAPPAKRWRFDSLLLPYYPYVRGAGPVGDILASTAADLGAGEDEEEDEKNNDEKHAEIQREFNTKLNRATTCYYHAQIHQLQPTPRSINFSPLTTRLFVSGRYERLAWQNSRG